MATLIKRGKASVTGCPFTFDVVLYPVPQSAKVTHNFELEKVKDVQGQDVAWISRNELLDADIMLKLLGDTAAHAAAGAAFLAPMAVITISGADATLWNTTWILSPGSSLDLKNDSVGELGLKLYKYVDSTQNTLAATTPS